MYNEFMSFALDSIRDKPVAWYLLDDSAPFQDYSGHNRTANATGGTPLTHAALVRGATSSRVFTDAIVGTFESPVFKVGKETDSFTLEVVVRPIVKPGVATTEQQVLGNPGQRDGITVNGTKVAFVTKYASAPEARAQYDIQVLRKFHAVGIHTANKNSLYIDGKLVAETDLTTAQQASSFASTGTDLQAGDSDTTTTGVALSGVGIYSYALTPEVIARHYRVSNDVPAGTEVPASFRGDRIPVTIDLANISNQSWDEEYKWNFGEHTGTYVDGDMLAGTVGGFWIGNLPLPNDTTSIYGLVGNWESENATVEVSFDGTTWETLTKGVKPAIITQGFDPTDKVLLVRVTFSNTGWVDNLTLSVIKSNTLYASVGRTVALNGATPRITALPFTRQDDWGIDIATGGSIVISADTVESSPARTLELWVKRNGATPTISMTGTTYVNGAVGTLRDDEWELMHIVAAANVTGSITINGPVQIGQVAIYDTALSAGTITNIYNEYVGNAAVRISDTSVVQLAEGATPVKMYAHDWSIKATP